MKASWCATGMTLVVLGCGWSSPAPAVAARADDAASGELTAFRAWLDSTHAGYECDEGPARFRNRTVESAYPGRRFYYVLTYARGTPSPFRKPTTVVAELSGGHVRPVHPVSLEGYRSGLVKARTAQDARLAAAAVLILATVDPGERRWKYDPRSFQAKKRGGRWMCTYSHGSALYTSRVSFDKAGGLASIQSGEPPVP